jgi:hypothetical protein
MPITLIPENKLLEQYKKIVNEISDECEWKTYFSSEEVCGIVFGILTKHDMQPKMCVEDFHIIYKQRVDESVKTKKEWQDNYGVNEIIHIIYQLLQENSEKIW